MMNVPILRLEYSEEEIEFIKNGIIEVLKSGYLTMAKKVAEFERLFAEFCGVKYAVAVNSGTSALEIILRTLRVEENLVICPTVTFMATPISVIHAGGGVVFVDVMKENLSIDPKDLKKKIKKYSKLKGVIIVHIGGIISEYFDEIKKICDDNNLFLIEDAAHAQGSEFNGVKAGALGISGAFSFYPTKIITTAEGGMLTTNDKKIYEMALTLREHGKKDHRFNIHTEFGYNWRFSEIHALLGLQQMKKVNYFVNERMRIAKLYDKLLSEVKDISLTKIPKNIKCAYYKYIVYLNERLEREKIKKEMQEKYSVILPGEVYSEPCHSQPVFKKYPGKMLNEPADTFSNAEYICKRQICLPLYPGLTDEEVYYVVASLKKVLR